MSLSASFNDDDNNASGPLQGTVTAITRLKQKEGDIFLLRIKPPAGFTYKAGQYVSVGFGKLFPRAYSISNAPGEDALSIHIKRTPGEVGLFLDAVLHVGDTVTLSPAAGTSTFDPADKRPLLIIGGGLGFTPLKAIAEAAVRRDQRATVHFFWGTNTPDEKYMRAYFEDMDEQYDNFHFHDINGQPVGEAAANKFKDLSGYRIFMAGPPAMVDATLPLLLARGASRSAISFDTPPPRKGLPPAPDNDNKRPA